MCRILISIISNEKRTGIQISTWKLDIVEVIVNRNRFFGFLPIHILTQTIIDIIYFLVQNSKFWKHDFKISLIPWILIRLIKSVRFAFVVDVHRDFDCKELITSYCETKSRNVVRGLTYDVFKVIDIHSELFWFFPMMRLVQTVIVFYLFFKVQKPKFLTHYVWNHWFRFVIHPFQSDL